jgi:hypothetical protein
VNAGVTLQVPQDIRNFLSVSETVDSLCGLVVRVPNYRARGPGFDSRHYQIS